MSVERRLTPFAKFVVVGWVGFVVQAAALATLAGAGLPYPLATLAAVELAIVHNFLWHERWTFGRGRRPSTWMRRLARFNGGAALLSLGGTTMLTIAAVELLSLPLIAANGLAVAGLSVVSYALADRWVWSRTAPVQGCVTGSR